MKTSQVEFFKQIVYSRFEKNSPSEANQIEFERFSKKAFFFKIKRFGNRFED